MPLKITKPLDNILNTKIKTKILRFFCRTGAEWNGRQVAREIKVTPKAAHEALSALSGEGVLLLRNMGKTHVYSLNEDSFLVSNMLKPLFVGEDRILGNIMRIIKRKVSSSDAKKGIIAIALFGSVNARKDHSMSDIDLAVIVENVRTKIAARRLFEEIDKKVLREFGNTISPYINTLSEFRSKYKKGMEVIKNILKSNDVIYGERMDKIL